MWLSLVPPLQAQLEPQESERGQEQEEEREREREIWFPPSWLCPLILRPTLPPPPSWCVYVCICVCTSHRGSKGRQTGSRALIPLSSPLETSLFPHPTFSLGLTS